VGGPWTNGADDATAAAEVDLQMRSLTNADSELWVMRSETDMWDQRNLMEKWLAQHGVLLEQAGFHGVQVLHYQILIDTLDPIPNPADDPTIDQG
jgi:hypothetical protein